MKRFILLLCAGLLLIPSCGRQPAPREPAPGWYVSEKDPMGAYIILNVNPRRGLTLLSPVCRGPAIGV